MLSSGICILFIAVTVVLNGVNAAPSPINPAPAPENVQNIAALPNPVLTHPNKFHIDKAHPAQPEKALPVEVHLKMAKAPALQKSAYQDNAAAPVPERPETLHQVPAHQEKAKSVPKAPLKKPAHAEKIHGKNELASAVYDDKVPSVANDVLNAMPKQHNLDKVEQQLSPEVAVAVNDGLACPIKNSNGKYPVKPEFMVKTDAAAKPEVATKAKAAKFDNHDKIEQQLSPEAAAAVKDGLACPIKNSNGKLPAKPEVAKPEVVKSDVAPRPVDSTKWSEVAAKTEDEAKPEVEAKTGVASKPAVGANQEVVSKHKLAAKTNVSNLALPLHQKPIVLPKPIRAY